MHFIPNARFVTTARPTSANSSGMYGIPYSMNQIYARPQCTLAPRPAQTQVPKKRQVSDAARELSRVDVATVLSNNGGDSGT